MENPNIPIKSWELYFPREQYTPYNAVISNIISIRKKLHLKESQIDEIISTLCYSCPFTQYQELGSPPDISAISCAVSEHIYETTGELLQLETHITEVPPSSSFSVVAPEHIGQLVSILATVSSVGFRKIENRTVYFECSKCNRIMDQQIKNNIYKAPFCPCKSRGMYVIQNHPGNRCIDKQDIRVQEICAYDRTAAVAEVELVGRMVSTVAPGDLVEVTGIVDSQLVQDAYRLKVLCNNIKKIQSKKIYSKIASEKNEAEEKNSCEIPDDITSFNMISERVDLMDILCAAFFSSIIGHRAIKEGIILSFFGGTKKETGNTSTRSEIHIFLIGDPGLGKSRILLSAAAVLPKSTVVSGSSSTPAGLTVSITHDPATGEYMADAGAVVLCDGGLCCIDEFDKLEDVYTLFEVMENQMITVAKGGVICSVPARATVLAAANPKNGHFNKNKTVQENLNFPIALLTRFDLVFILKDDNTEDQSISRELIDELAKKRKKKVTQEFTLDLLRRYIDYARHTAHPVLTKAAKDVIKEYYLELRKRKNVSIRSLETLLRLTEAHSRMFLRSVASSVDAESAINVYENCFVGGCEEPAGKQTIEDRLRIHTAVQGQFIERRDLLCLIKEEMGNTRSYKDPNDILELLNAKGILLLCGDGKYKINLRQ